MTQPDILLATVDCLRADTVYDSTPQTPFLDTLSTDSLVFESAFSTGAWTAPSFVGMMTGEHPRSYAPDMSIHRYPETIAEVLQEEGYRTVATLDANYWISESQGFDRGFDEFHNYVDADEFVTAKRRESDENHNEFAQRLPSGLVERDFGILDAAWDAVTSSDRLFSVLQQADMLRESEKKGRGAEELIDAFLTSYRVGEKPTFGWIHFMDVHHPYLPERKSFDDYALFPWRLINYVNNASVRPGVSLGSFGEHLLRKAYDRKVTEVDQWLKRLVDTARQARNRDLVVIIVGDHGEEFHEHGRFNHVNKPYNELVHVPLLIHGMETGEVNRNVSLIDLKYVIEAVGNGKRTIGDHFETERPVCRYISHGDEIVDRTEQALDGRERPSQCRTVIEGGHKVHFDSELNDVEAYDLIEDFYEQRDISDEQLCGDVLESAVEEYINEKQELADQRLVRELD